MKINHLDRLLNTIHSGRVALGAVVTLADCAVGELAGDAGMDFIWIDMEHAPHTLETVQRQVMAVRGTGCAPFVRVPANNPDLIKPVLDLAPAAVIIPMVNSASEAAAAVAACRYPPIGIRGCGVRRATRYGTEAFPDYLARSEREPMVIIQVEHRQAVDNLDAILQVPELDSICLGPCDLSGSLGILNQIDDPGLNRMLDDVCARVKAAGLLLGTAAGDLPRWRQRGVNYFAGVSDWGAMAATFRNFIKEAAL
jgi:2-keto-3-deoxy-L-rhamnonate aldolase RhmA